MAVSKSGYYAWRKRDTSKRQQANQTLWSAIQEVYANGRSFYGYRRVHAGLKKLGYSCSRNRVARLMRQHVLRAKRKRRYVRTTQSKHEYPITDNLLARNFQANAPNQKWSSDIPTGISPQLKAGFI